MEEAQSQNFVRSLRKKVSLLAKPSCCARNHPVVFKAPRTMYLLGMSFKPMDEFPMVVQHH